MRFSDNLRNMRLARGLTQMQLAQALGTSQSAITAWETQTREPDFKTIQRLADYFHVPITSLLPSDDHEDDDRIKTISESLHSNPKLGLLFDRTRFMSDSDLDAVLAVVTAITKEREQ